MKLFTLFRKWITCAVLASFIVTQFTPQASASSLRISTPSRETPLLQKPLPAELGMVLENHPGETGKTVVLIQDAHASLSVQQNIYGLIEYLHQTYGIRDLLLEGATQKIEPELYRLFDSPSANALFASRLFENGEFTGAEKFMFDQMLEGKCGKRCVEARGMEEASSYVRDVEIFREIISRQNEIGQGMDELTRLFEKMATRKLHPELLEFLKKMDVAALLGPARDPGPPARRARDGVRREGGSPGGADDDQHKNERKAHDLTSQDDRPC